MLRRSDRWNVLDGAIVLVSVGEILATDLFLLLDDGSLPKLTFLRILRLLRVVRVLRLLRTWRGLYQVCAPAKEGGWLAGWLAGREGGRQAGRQAGRQKEKE